MDERKYHRRGNRVVQFQEFHKPCVGYPQKNNIWQNYHSVSQTNPKFQNNLEDFSPEKGWVDIERRIKVDDILETKRKHNWNWAGKHRR